MPSEEPRYRRILLKVSGEALMGEKAFGLDPKTLGQVAGEIYSLRKKDVEVGVVVGGGNIFRGLSATGYGFDRVAADHMGMLATVINAIALGEALKGDGVDARVMSALAMERVAEPYERLGALEHLSRGRVVIFAGGTGNPFFSTDTAATLRALEIQAAAFLKATKVDGVFDADPEKIPSAKRFIRLTYDEVLARNLKVMDLTAVSLAKDQGLPIIVFNMKMTGNIERVVFGENVGTFIGGDVS